MKVLGFRPIVWKTIVPQKPSDFRCMVCHDSMATNHFQCEMAGVRMNLVMCGKCVSLDPDDIEAKLVGTTMKTVKQAADILRVNESRVRQFVYSGRLFAQKIGRDLLIKTQDLWAFAAVERKTGRPIEQTPEGNNNEETDRNSDTDTMILK